jgi:hypothetical protein
MPRKRADEDDDRYEEDDEPRARRRRAAVDDDEDERPARKVSRRSADDDDDEDEKPAKRRSRARDDDDDEDERPAKRRSRARDEDEDDEKPTKRSSRRRAAADDDDEDDAPRSKKRRSRDDDDDDDDAPAKSTGAIKSGWGQARKVRDESSSYANSVKLDKEDIIIKFLQDEPYASYREHWLDGVKGKKSHLCISELDPKGCPLCAIGEKARAKFSFNVAVWDDGWTIKSLDVGVTVFEQLGNFNEDKRNGPLTKLYWAVKRTGKGPKSVTNFTPVKEEDLEEEWDCDPLTKSEAKGFKLYDPSVVTKPSRRDLQELARDLDE